MALSELVSHANETIKVETTALIHDGMRQVQSMVGEVQRQLELDADYHQQATQQLQATVASFADQALLQSTSDTRSVLYPFAATDIATAFSFKPDVLITLDQRNPFADSSVSTVPYAKQYLTEKLIAGMNFGTMPISHLTWCTDLCLAGLEPEDVRLNDVFKLPGHINKPQPTVTEWEYRFAGRRSSVRHVNIASVDLLDITSNAFANMSGYISSLVHGTTLIAIDKASFYKAPAFIQAVVEEGTLISDSRKKIPPLTPQLEGQPRYQLEEIWKRLNAAYRVPPLHWGYADSPSDIGVFQFSTNQ